MGYNPKTIYWDFADFEKGGVATLSPNFGSNTLEREKAKSDSLVDLKLGSLGDFQTEFPNSSKDHTALMDPFSSKAGSSKRARTPSSGSHIVSCLVDGCEADLSKCRDYHRRHKVCEMHSKTSRVTIGGHEQRFCQQCSRFHSLGEFDEGKRSCRKRLEGHNRRRRKPQPEPLTVNPNLVPASQGGRFLAFGNQPEFPATSMVNCLWSGTVKSESNPAPYSSLVSSSYSNPHRGRHFPFLQVPESPLTGPSSAGPQKMFYSGINQVIDSDRALSLLSSSAETSDVGLGRIIHPSPTSISQPNLSGLQIEGFAPYAGSHTQGFQCQPGDSELLPNMRSNNSVCQDGSSASGGYQTLSFSWE